MGLLQLDQDDESRLHSNVEPDSLLLNVAVAVVWLVGLDGPESIEASGGVVSIVQFQYAGLPVLPAWSVALTEKLWLPSDKSV